MVACAIRLPNSGLVIPTAIASRFIEAGRGGAGVLCPFFAPSAAQSRAAPDRELIDSCGLLRKVCVHRILRRPLVPTFPKFVLLCCAFRAPMLRLTRSCRVTKVDIGPARRWRNLLKMKSIYA